MNEDGGTGSGEVAMAREAVNEARKRLEALGLEGAERDQCQLEYDAAKAKLDKLEKPS